MYCYTGSCNIAEITLKRCYTPYNLSIRAKENVVFSSTVFKEKSQGGSQVVKGESRGIVVAKLSKKRSRYCRGQVVKEKVKVLWWLGCQRKGRGVVVARLSKIKLRYCGSKAVKEKVEVLSWPGYQRSRDIIVARLRKKKSRYCHGQIAKDKVEVLSWPDCQR